ncbi:DUF1917-domain-containing protein [Polyplosphaeria fusca]|uniref:DUF1917-domain-containing protein n=1 Tax=Polyplosphaeria fusca TaxID=682080 RepID=A0A9P4R9V5_9PLEO|nr:DUF1917-domain-containing protein [Polyplosphaeria fusca]
MPPTNFHNIYSNKPGSWQLDEPVDEFIKRLPPLTTPTLTFDWIWCANPYPGSQSERKDVSLDLFLSDGVRHLEQSSQQREHIRRSNSGKDRGTVSRLLNKESDELETALRSSPKRPMSLWEEEDLTRVWKLIVEGTINDRLGCTAKVATDDGKNDGRLICVYTKDFRDTNDVRRVLQELDSLGLARQNCGRNGLQASIYSSQKMLASANNAGVAPTTQKKPSTPEAFRKVADQMDIN